MFNARLCSINKHLIPLYIYIERIDMLHVKGTQHMSVVATRTRHVRPAMLRA